MTMRLSGSLLLVGAGKMGGAMLSGWLERGLDPGLVFVQDPAPPEDSLAMLRRAGVQPTDRIVAVTAKSPEAVALYLASLKLAAVYVPLNPAYTDTELAYYLDDAKPATVVSTGGRAPAISTMTPAPVLSLDGSTGTLMDQAAAAPGESAQASRARSRDPARRHLCRTPAWHGVRGREEIDFRA